MDRDLKQAVATEIDLRLFEVWLDLLGEGFGDWGLGDLWVAGFRGESALGDRRRGAVSGARAREVVGAYMRMAYGMGYRDALRDARDGRSPLGGELGLSIDLDG
jgi:hypothetical protein